MRRLYAGGATRDVWSLRRPSTRSTAHRPTNVDALTAIVLTVEGGDMPAEAAEMAIALDAHGVRAPGFYPTQ